MKDPLYLAGIPTEDLVFELKRRGARLRRFWRWWWRDRDAKMAVHHHVCAPPVRFRFVQPWPTGANEEPWHVRRTP